MLMLLIDAKLLQTDLSILCGFRGHSLLMMQNYTAGGRVSKDLINVNLCLSIDIYCREWEAIPPQIITIEVGLSSPLLPPLVQDLCLYC